MFFVVLAVLKTHSRSQRKHPWSTYLFYMPVPWHSRLHCGCFKPFQTQMLLCVSLCVFLSGYSAKHSNLNLWRPLRMHLLSKLVSGLQSSLVDIRSRPCFLGPGDVWLLPWRRLPLFRVLGCPNDFRLAFSTKVDVSANQPLVRREVSIGKLWESPQL